MQNNIKVSVIAPIYGVEKYIERFARSVFSLDYDNIEYVFVNDCTKDNSMAILLKVSKEYPNRLANIKIINHETNKGLAGARLTGINNSTGDYIWLVDSDDYADKAALQEALPYMQNGVDIICSNFYRITADGIKDVYINQPTIDSIITSYSSPSVWKFIIKRSLLFDNNIFPIQGINFSEDHVLMSRLFLKAETVEYLQDKFFYYYDCTNMGSYMRNINLKSLENLAQDGIVVYDYYFKQGAIEAHREALVFMLSSRLEKLCRANSKHSLNTHLIERIISINKIYGAFLSKILKFPQLMRCFNKHYLNKSLKGN